MVDRAPLVGRGAELDRLDAVIGAVVGGSDGDAPGAVDLTGPAGMGKSRLLTEVCRRARARGLTVLRGRATEYERHIPFRLFTDAFADLDPEATRGQEADPAVAPVLYGTTGPTERAAAAHRAAGTNRAAGTEPYPGTDRAAGTEPYAGVAGVPAADPGPPADPGRDRDRDRDPYGGSGGGSGGLGGPEAPVDRFLVHRAAARMLTTLARDTGGGRRGLLIALDDLHWADPASLELLDHLVRHPPRGPVLLVVARRDRQTSASLAAALTRGVDTGAVLRLDLGPLPERTCVEQLAPGLPPDRAGRLYAASGGNPLYFLTLLQGQFAVPAVPAGGLSALLLDELTPLTAAQRRTAEAVAVLGDQATAPLLAPTAEVAGPGPLDGHLAALAGRDLLRPGPGGSWSLRHPVLRTVVYENTEPRERAGLHRRAAVALAGAGAAAAVRAHHVERALTGWDPQAAATLLEAAGQAETTAPASCAHWLGVVLGILPDTPEHRPRRRGLLLRRARALSACGQLRASRDLLTSLVAQVDGADPDDGLRAAAVTLCASVERHLGRYGEAVALLRRELSRAPRPADALALGLELGSSAPHVLSYDEVREDVRRAFGLALRLGNEPAAAGALTTAALGETYGGEPATARSLADRAAARVDALADRELADLCEPLARLAWTEFYLDRYPEAERHADRGLALARRVGPPHLLPHLLVCKAVVHMNTCRLESALELSEEAENIARGIGSDELLGLVLGNKAQVLIPYLPPGDPLPLSVAQEAVELAGVRSSWWASLGWCVLSWAALYSGDHQRARSAMLRAGRGPELTGLQPSMRPLFLEALVTAAVAAGDLQEAESWAARAAADAARLGIPSQHASALRSAAVLRAARGEPSAAADLYVRAATEAARSGAVLWEAQSLLMAAPLAARPGSSRRASVLWQRGRRLAETGGSRLLTGLADLFPPAAPAPAPTPLLQLTPREREIAALVTEGLTTPAIAARLYLSPRTVDTHLSHIFRKTGVTSRAALATLTARSAASP
ncbi:AAA family ATPase [Streptomyces sp. NPDC056387]|uniref:helix-turn-helix transcriptional regulator n=1 Tax=Streptomyces sp. NPDC056387 TaxID=3345803 RepID=UPI0035D55613